MRKCARALLSLLTAVSLTCMGPSNILAQRRDRDEADRYSTKTPIKHLVVIFQENISFDHYFATYPFATNPPGEPAFHAADDTPTVDNLLSAGLLDQNPNSTQPFRLDRTQAVTCDQDHGYSDEQKAFDKGLMDKFPESVGTGSTTSSPCPDYGHGTGLVMGYYDGNTVTAIWNYAQHFAMSDNSYSTMFGPSAPGAINLVSGLNYPATLVPTRPNGTAASASGNIANSASMGALIGDARPAYDDCVPTNPQLQNTSLVSMGGANVGELLNSKGITWGWFQGGFGPTGYDAMGRAICGSHHVGLAGDDVVKTVGDYIPHHEPFEYYTATTNVHHLPPSSREKIGKTDQANHQYDLQDFATALEEGRLPAVSYLKAGAYEDGHPGYSDPLDEQIFLVKVINALMESPEWNETAVVIAYDDSDGWYDHTMDPVVNQSDAADDFLTGTGMCGTIPQGAVQGRCGYGPRQPLLVISPYAKQNYVDHSITDQSSILRFVEDNWELGRIGGGSTDVKAGTLNNMFDFDDHNERHGFDRDSSKLLLNPDTGEILRH